MLARQIGCLCPGLTLAQYRIDLLFREPDTLHRPSFRRAEL